MKKSLSHLNEFRYVDQELRFSGITGHPNFGIFIIPSVQDRRPVKVIFSRGFYGWDHVSISKQKHPPSWKEMCWIKGLFFDDEEVVIQLHPAKSEWISNHDNCLHLWRPVVAVVPLPPPELVGVKGIDHEQMKNMSHEQRFALVDEAAERLKANSEPEPASEPKSDLERLTNVILDSKFEDISHESLFNVVNQLLVLRRQKSGLTSDQEELVDIYKKEIDDAIKEGRRPDDFVSQHRTRTPTRKKAVVTDEEAYSRNILDQYNRRNMRMQQECIGLDEDDDYLQSLMDRDRE